MVTASSYHVKVKRHKTIYFVECQVDDTVGNLRSKVASIAMKPIKEIRLTWKDQALDDAASLASLGIVLDSVIFLQFWLTNDQDASKSQWEPLSVENYPPFEAEESQH